MKKLLAYFRGYRKEVVLGPLFKMFEALLELFVPLVVAAIIADGIGGDGGAGDRGYVIGMVGVLVLLGIVGLAASLTAQYFAAKAAVGFSTSLKNALFGKLQSLGYAEYDRLGSATMIARMTGDMNQLQTGVNMTLRLFLRSPFVVFGAMIMAFTIDVRSALVFVAVIPVLSVVVFGIMLLTMPLYNRTRRGLDRLLGMTRENLTGVRVIRAFRKEEDEIESFDRANQTFTAQQKFVGKISALMNPLTYVIVNLGIFVLVYTGAWRVEGGFLEQAKVVALYNYMSQILVELIKLADLIITMTKAAACGRRIAGVLELQPSAVRLPAQESRPEPFVVFDHVSMTYGEGGAPSLSDITFHAERGETIGVIGGTGTGKTTLVHLLAHLYDASEGQVRVGGCDVRSLDPVQYTKRVGIVPQKAVLFTGSIRDNLLWGNPDADDDTLWRALKVAQAAQFVRDKGGLDVPVIEGGKNFSGGQRQRLTIARALVRHPEILILDDSSSALDYATDAALRRALREDTDGATVFLVSQRTASIMHADRILVLEDGILSAVGTHEELLQTSEVYREIYDSQYRKEGEA